MPARSCFAVCCKGMHWATYTRHMVKIARGDDMANLAFIDFVRRKFPGMVSDIEFYTLVVPPFGLFYGQRPNGEERGGAT